MSGVKNAIATSDVGPIIIKTDRTRTVNTVEITPFLEALSSFIILLAIMVCLLSYRLTVKNLSEPG